MCRYKSMDLGQLSPPQRWGALICATKLEPAAVLAERCGVSPVRAARWLRTPRFVKAVRFLRLLPFDQRRGLVEELMPYGWAFRQGLGR